ncbi:DUF883 family protein [Pseudochelatococcus contaminans]|uniref:ElaB/YqjD/DUF883 family membrane-anchored ribosome-binding protein n=1 Tax=Pseudochelatococcus contaminans TaxID=1538103 RepID=A0A7W6EHI3_9HYPH|nr:DUF883 family protein [Pseudochelatococcus contaminans]MBB3809797.1 ElaB/YqjD/DUF883 family membrane-anchored ribosome-binding protein [Pseudochelatococcus contaminans]
MAEKSESIINSEIETLRNEIKSLTDSVADVVRRQTDHARDNVKGFTDTVSSAAHSASQTGHRLAADAQEAVGNATSKVEACIERNPVQSVLVAAGVGFVLGLLSRR